MRIPFLVYAAMAIALSLPRVSAAQANVKLIRSDDRVRVEIAGQLFTEYIFRGASRPYLYPVVAADGTRLTRDFPMKKSAEEDQDHPHHRSLWFAHSDVNGVDFWNEDDAGSRRPKGKIIHEQLLEPSRDSSNLIQARSRWVAPDGKVFCTDETRIGFGALGDTRLIDFQVTLLAPADASVQLGDNKDGVIALRLAQWLNLPRPPATGRKFTGGQGHIVNANGDRDGAAWGKRAPWCDFYAEHGSKTYGIAVFDHPQNLRHPTWWHARDYGLFAANPIGWHDFEAKQTKVGAGNYVIPAGGSLTLRYRIYIHSGNEKDAKLAQRYAEYAAEK